MRHGTKPLIAYLPVIIGISCLHLSVLIAEEPEPLLSSRPLQRKLQRGQIHSYRIDLDAGDYLQVLVNQQDVDLIVTLLDPRGEPLIEVDNPSGADGSKGPERIVWVAAETGRFSIDVRGLTKARAGSYEISRERLGPATARDRQRAAAEKALADGDVAYYKGASIQSSQAILRYEQALAGFIELGDLSRQADTHFRLGKARRRQGEVDHYARALDHYTRALELYEKCGNKRQQAISLHYLGVILTLQEEIEQALTALQRARGLWEQVKDARGLASTLNLLGIIYRQLGEGQLALGVYDQALALWQKLGYRSDEATTLHNRGRLYSHLGKKEQALADLQQSLEISRDLGEGVAIKLNSLGMAYLKQGDKESAAEQLVQALKLHKPEDSMARAMTYIGLGWTLLDADPGKARRYFEDAEKIFHAGENRAWEAKTLDSLGWLSSSQGQNQEALRYFDRALCLYRESRERAGIVETLLGVATAQRRLDNLQGSLQTIELALTSIEDLRTRVSASPDLRASYFSAQQSYYDFYIDLLMDLHQHDPQAGYAATALTASERARARSLLEILSLAGVDLERDVDPALCKRKRDLGRRINARELKLVRLHAISANERGTLADRVEAEQEVLLREYEKVRAQIYATNPAYADLDQPRLLGIAEIQHMLDPQTLLLEYKLGEKCSFLWAVSRASISVHQLPGRAEVESKARRINSLISEPRRRSQKRLEWDLADLSEWLLKPVAEHMEKKQRLLIVADGALHFLPFSALPIPHSSAAEQPPFLPLVAQYEIVSLPSVSTLAVLRRRLADRPPAPKTLAVVADPVFGPDDPRLASIQTQPAWGSQLPTMATSGKTNGSGYYRRLVYSHREAEAILELVPPDQAFHAFGFSANREMVQSGALSQYRIVHFATHGELNAEHPELSRLVLSLIDKQSRPQQGLLTVFDIYDLELPAELVVLSACQTALGKEIRGEGVVGLTRGFIHAGAARVLVSLWQVGDEPTATLMRRFYTQLLVQKQPPAAALRAAQISIRQEEQWRQAFFWAGFVLHGEWRDIHRQRQ